MTAHGKQRGATGRCHRIRIPNPNPNPNSNPNRDQVTASSDQTARLWDVASGETIRHYTGHHKAVIALALHDRMNTVPGGGAA